jgi:hypothetical protein
MAFQAIAENKVAALVLAGEVKALVWAMTVPRDVTIFICHQAKLSFSSLQNGLLNYKSW